MARFQFRLHQVLAYRETLLEQAHAELADLERRQAALESELAHVMALYRQSLQDFPSLEHAVDVAHAMIHQAYVRSLEARQDALQQEIVLLRQRIEPLRQEMIERHQQVEMLRKIREREWSRWRQREDALAAKQIDELVAGTVLRSRMRR